EAQHRQLLAPAGGLVRSKLICSFVWSFFSPRKWPVLNWAFFVRLNRVQFSLTGSVLQGASVVKFIVRMEAFGFFMIVPPYASPFL
ncbi:MAG: hypothetical protein ABJM02_18990, partial [Paracoccaceae bacterium]